MTFNPDSDLQREVAGQPDDWAGVVARLPELADALPATGARAAVAGCGTSYFMAQSYASVREEAGHGETDAFAAWETGAPAATTASWRCPGAAPPPR